MLTFEEKLDIIESFPELERKNVSLGRVNFHYEESMMDKKTVVYHLHPNGNGFVYAGQLPEAATDDKGMVNIRDYSADDLRSLITGTLRYLSGGTEELTKTTAEQAIIGEEQEERWIDGDGHILLLVHENDLWNIYSGLNLEAAFETYQEAEAYMKAEAFSRK
jgi:exonuclease VII small subunit